MNDESISFEATKSKNMIHKFNKKKRFTKNEKKLLHLHNSINVYIYGLTRKSTQYKCNTSKLYYYCMSVCRPRRFV